MTKLTTISPPLKPLAKSFEPKNFEAGRYQFWLDQDCFDAADENVAGQKSFCIMIPPPNVTGALHMGHALTNTIQDALVRWRRMHGDNALWLPGTDHAGIATQTQVEKAIAKEGKGPTGRPLSRHDLGREKFLERTWKWKEDHAHIITGQLKRLGSSLDWKRERFTMDEGLSQAVREVFVRLYEEGLMYRGERIINWCPRCQTALSDLEVVPTERKGHLYHIRYAIKDDSGQPVKNAAGENTELIIATTRPETLLGDTALAVHPEDERFAHIHGNKARLPLIGRVIPVITDEYVDREFGSGGLKVTPAHDFNDYELGMKHQLPFISVMGKDGRITDEGGPYAGLKFAEAREKIVHDLKEAGLLVKVEDHPMKIGLCQRCETVAEPIMSKQWFVKIEPLAKPAIAAVEDGRIQFTPKNWEKTYFEWMYNIRDWCVSRQLWWGHQIPAWYCGNCEGITVAKTDPQACVHCQAPASQLTRDEDVLDTWFSSGLWPFSTLGWPENTQALKTFYPTTILETGFDIIFFWVARMIMMGLHFTGEVPFHHIYLHALVRDEKGEKMSKSKGNVIDPLTVIDQHGADPLRFTLASMAGQGRDIKLAVDRVENYRAFANKIWNATKFLHLQLGDAHQATQRGPDDLAVPGLFPSEAVAAPEGGAEAWLLENHATLSPVNRWILSRLQTVTEKVEAGFAGFELDQVAGALYEFAWLELCDWFIEFSKLPLRKDGPARRESVITLHYTLEQLFKLMHPIMPFVTDELWLSLPWKTAANTPARERDGKPAVLTVMFQKFPTPIVAFRDAAAERAVTEQLKRPAELVRNFRGETGLSPAKELAVTVAYDTDAAVEFFRANLELVQFVTRTKLTFTAATAVTEAFANSATVIPASGFQLMVPLDEEARANEVKRLTKEVEKVTVDLQHVQGKLAKESFVARAPKELIEKERENERAFLLKIEQFKTALKKLGGG